MTNADPGLIDASAYWANWEVYALTMLVRELRVARCDSAKKLDNLLAAFNEQWTSARSRGYLH